VFPSFLSNPTGLRLGLLIGYIDRQSTLIFPSQKNPSPEFILRPNHQFRRSAMNLNLEGLNSYETLIRKRPQSKEGFYAPPYFRQSQRLKYEKKND
jgi:hypothetical protein